MTWFVKYAKVMRGLEKSSGIAVGIFTQYVKTAKGRTKNVLVMLATQLQMNFAR